MSRTIHISSRVLCREVHGEAVLLDLASQQYFGLDEVATRIWQLLAEHGRREPVLAALEREFDADRVTLAADFDRFVERLDEAGLVSFEAPDDDAGEPGAETLP